MQNQMPLLNHLMQLSKKNHISFHMPGHKAGRGFGEVIHPWFQMDVTELASTDNLHHPQREIKEAQALAALSFGAKHTFFLTGGSTAGILAMIATVTQPEDILLVDRNCHASVLHALLFSRVRPVFIGAPLIDGMVGGITKEQVEQALWENPHAVGVFLTSPTYYGLCADMEGIAKVVHQRDKVLLVDEAHGAHFAFHPALPMPALKAGADMVVQSAHKTLSALTQSAYLHVGSEGISMEKTAQFLRMFQSSSPSFLQMASLDFARFQMANEGEKRLECVLSLLSDFRESFSCVDASIIGQGGVVAVDPTRLVIDVRESGKSGYEVQESLRTQNIEIEMADDRYLVCIVTIANTTDDLEKLKKALLHIGVKKMPTSLAEIAYLPVGEMVLSPYEAFYGRQRKVPLCQAIGKICAVTVSAFPPCVPLICAGERVSAEAVDWLLHASGKGVDIIGLSPSQEITIFVEKLP